MFFLKGKDKLFPDDCGRQDDGKGKLCFGDPELCRQSKFYFNLSIFLSIYLYIYLSIKLWFGDPELCRQSESSQPIITVSLKLFGKSWIIIDLQWDIEIRLQRVVLVCLLRRHIRFKICTNMCYSALQCTAVLLSYSAVFKLILTTTPVTEWH